MNILIIDKVHPILIHELEKHQHNVECFPDISLEETTSIINNYDGIVVRSKFRITKELMEKAPNLKFVARAGVGLDIFDLDYAYSNNIKVINTAGANANAVGEHAIGMLLSLSSKITQGNDQVKDFNWEREQNRGIELNGKTLGLIGYGNTGQAFTQKLKGFDCEILAYDKFKKGFSNEYVKEVSLEVIFKKAEIVSLHIPLTDETEYMCNEDFFNSFDNNIVFINTARGKIVRTSDLLKALEYKKVIGACLDVLEFEDFKNLSNDMKSTYQKIFFKKNVIVTPHVAGWSFQSFEKISKVLAKNILALTN